VLRAVIFDFDGVIVDSERAHFEMFRRVLAEEGVPLTWEQYYGRYLAMDDKGCFTAVLSDRGIAADASKVSDLVRRKSRYYSEHAQGSLEMIPGSVELLDALRREGIPAAIASGALRNEIEHVLDVRGLRGHFSVIVSAEDCSAGKPDPEPFLKAMDALSREVPGLRPPECLVVEDSLHGIAAAKKAGMKCLAVATSYPVGQLGEADMAVESLVGISVSVLRSLFAE